MLDGDSMEKEATAHTCVVHVSTMTEGKKEMELAFLKALCFHQRGLGAAGCGSIGAMTQASFGQVYRVQVDPGEAVTPAMRDLFCLHLGIKKKEFTRLEKVFKGENPRYNPHTILEFPAKYSYVPSKYHYLEEDIVEKSSNAEYLPRLTKSFEAFRI
jgi:hypothetical protein